MDINNLNNTPDTTANYDPKDIEDNKVLALFSYIGLLFLIPLLAAKDSDVLYTDVWASMGQENEAKIRMAAFSQYKIDNSVMAIAKKDAMVLHCLPAHREEEITGKVFEEHASEIFEEAENRLHAQKAVLATLLG